MHSWRATGFLVLACVALFCSSAVAFDGFGAGINPQPISPWERALQTAGVVPAAAFVPVSPPLSRSTKISIDGWIGESKSLAISTEAHLRDLLASFAVTLRDIRYRRGGHTPSTGFDCSGFVRYVYQQSLGWSLPSTSANQFRTGVKISRANIKTGDLVFFRTRGRRISHVGIYLGGGRFIHAPTSGKRVTISHLDDAYWSRHFAGAKRPNVLS